MTKIHELNGLGQSIWFDFIRRSFTASGELQELIDLGVRGGTSNPSIFEKAIAGSADYDADIQRLVREGKQVEEIYEALVLQDIADAADLLRPLYDESGATDGFVSLEVSPTLAHDTNSTIADAKRLYSHLDRPNVMIKIPATPAGMPAITAAIGAGINVNVTLIFSIAHYEAVVEAYLSGLEQFVAAGGELAGVASVASFFISRVDTSVDSALTRAGNHDMLGRIAVDNAKVAYSRFRELFSGERWKKLSKAGARVQRTLWASTGTKNADYSDTLYLESVIGPDTVNTVPPATLDLFLDHGKVATTIENDLDESLARIAQLSRLGIDLETITQTLQDEGVAAFEKSFHELLASIERKRDQLTGEVA